MSGASLAEVSAVLGHSSYDMVRRYTHWSNSHLKSVVEEMNSDVFGDEDT